MGFAELAQNLAVAGFKLAGNIPATCTYTSTGATTYVNGQYVTTGSVDYTGLKLLFTDYESREVDGTVILSTDMKAIIPQLTLVATPKKQDTITDSDSVVWGVERIRKDSARALWILQIRKP